MNKLAFVTLVAACATLSQAFSFAGDWDFTYDATLTYNTTFGNGTENLVGTDNVAITQTTTDEFQFPLSFGGLAVSGDFVVSGTTVTDINTGQTSDPFTVLLNGSNQTVRVTYPTFNITGEITGSNPAITDVFGDRAFEITGNPVTITGVQIEVQTILGWLNLGTNNQVVVNSWDLSREAVPEPATMTILGLAAVVALRKRKRA